MERGKKMTPEGHNLEKYMPCDRPAFFCFQHSTNASEIVDGSMARWPSGRTAKARRNGRSVLLSSSPG